MKNIVALCGPSGVGKGYVKDLVLQRASVAVFEPVVITTRKERSDDGRNRRAGIAIADFQNEVELGTAILPHQPFGENAPYYAFDSDSFRHRNLLTEIHPLILEQFRATFSSEKLLVLAMTAEEDFLRGTILQRNPDAIDIGLRIANGALETNLISRGKKSGAIDQTFEITQDNRDEIQSKIAQIAIDWFSYGNI